MYLVIFDTYILRENRQDRVMGVFFFFFCVSSLSRWLFRVC